MRLQLTVNIEEATVSRKGDLIRFYDLLDVLEQLIGGKRKLVDCSGDMDWPQRGVYFFFEPGETRKDSGFGPRVVRIGTHALKDGSHTTLWNRLSQHRGVKRTSGGNHRGSVFRLSGSDPAKTLFVIPCSGAKQAFAGRVRNGPSILDELPSHLAKRLADARIGNVDCARIDETTMVPAWQRYGGTLYQVSGPTLGKMVDDGRHVLILSGGYGVVLASEPIGIYDARFRACGKFI